MKSYGSAYLVANGGIRIALPIAAGLLQLIFNPSFVDELQRRGLFVFGADFLLGAILGAVGLIWLTGTMKKIESLQLRRRYMAKFSLLDVCLCRPPLAETSHWAAKLKRGCF